MEKVFEVRFWNAADVNIKVCGKYSHPFPTYKDAWHAACAMLATAVRVGAIEMDINNDFYPIEED